MYNETKKYKIQKAGMENGKIFPNEIHKAI